MISSLAYSPIFGIPAVAYGGLTTLILLLITAYIGHSIMSGQGKFSIKIHMGLAITTIIFAALHAFFVLSRYLNY